MKASEVDGYKFTQDPTDESFIRCPKCNVLSPLSSWRECEVYCEDCGSHDAMVCPGCDERFDHVWSPTFEVLP